MTVLADHQFEILPTIDAINGFVFGIGADVSINEDGFDPGENEWITQDGRNTRRGVNAFGRDVLGPKTWIWQSHTDQEDVATAVAILEKFSAAWAPELLAREPSVMTSLRYKLGGRTRRIFGRPRRYAAPPTNLILSGFVPVTHDFQCVDAFTYDDLESSVSVPYSTSSQAAGWTFPKAFPILTQLATSGAGSSQIHIGGNARAYPVIRFNGPWINPKIVTNDWSLSWTGEVTAGGWVEIDCRPWALTVLNQSGASVVGGLDRRTWLEDCWFTADSNPQISLSGASASGAASATIRWRNTWTSI